MINAIKNSTLTELQVKTLNIRWKELDYWSLTFKTIAAQSALLAGFCYSGLSMPIDSKISQSVQLGFLASTTGGMGFGLCAIFIASLVSVIVAHLSIVRNARAWSCAQRC